MCGFRWGEGCLLFVQVGGGGLGSGRGWWGRAVCGFWLGGGGWGVVCGFRWGGGYMGSGGGYVGSGGVGVVQGGGV